MLLALSFVIPAFNEATLLPAAILAIQAEVRRYAAATGGPLPHEILVVDDHSTDTTPVIAASLGARVIGCEAHGVTRARQAGYLAALYNIQAFIDADNRIPPGWLDNFSQLTDDPNCVAITGPVWFDEQGPSVRALATCFLLVQQAAHKAIGASLQGGNFGLKRTALIVAGGMSIGIDFYGEDTDLGKRLSKVGEVKFLRAMWCNSSARRFNQAGYFYTAFLYSLNFCAIHWLGRPLTLGHRDFRTT